MGKWQLTEAWIDLFGTIGYIVIFGALWWMT
jgi:hypothetical protein